MQVRPGRLATIADSGDLLTGLHSLPHGHQGLIDVPVDRCRSIVMLKTYPEAETVCRTGVEHGSVGCRVDGSSDSVGDVEPGVRSPPSWTEIRGQGPGDRTNSGRSAAASRAALTSALRCPFANCSIASLILEISGMARI